MNLHVVQSPDDHEPPEVPKHSLNDLLHLAPKSLLVVSLFMCTGLIGGLINEVRSGMTKEQSRLEAAINDAPSKYQARLSERVAVVETEMSGVKKAVEANTKETAELKVEVKLLAALIRGGK